jgi:hypothetical protein
VIEQGGSAMAGAEVGRRIGSSRRRRAQLADREARLLAGLLASAPSGLSHAYLADSGEFAFTVRGTGGSQPTQPTQPTLSAEGTSLRYAAMAALGLALVPDHVQKQVLADRDATVLAARCLQAAADTTDPGAFALACWAAAETGAGVDEASAGRLVTLARSELSMPTVDSAWVLTALVAVGLQDERAQAAEALADRLMASQRATGLFPHWVDVSSAHRLRRHIGCFADQVYPVQALARFHAASGSSRAIEAANRCATRICGLQGADGQWWWHYDVRSGDVTEGYPVYSVHQHAMAPMALFDLQEAGGADFTANVVRGLGWVQEHPEVSEPMVAGDTGLVWRSVQRKEPAHVSRSLRAGATAVHPRLKLRALDALFPPGTVDHECRPYELGWLLYAWLHTDNDPAPSAGDQT